MNSKECFTDTVIRKDLVSDEENSYSYELILREGTRTASWRIPLYSIKVSMTDSDGIFTSADVTDAFADASRAIRFYEKLVRNMATPIDLPYVVEDEMG
ncbi:MAG: hypothetical protein IJX92_07735 [Clostridia bacterium]|nr:hypothetical protein [Clostridia bacterium]